MPSTSGSGKIYWGIHPIEVDHEVSVFFVNLWCFTRIFVWEEFGKWILFHLGYFIFVGLWVEPHLQSVRWNQYSVSILRACGGCILNVSHRFLLVMNLRRCMHVVFMDLQFFWGLKMLFLSVLLDWNLWYHLIDLSRGLMSLRWGILLVDVILLILYVNMAHSVALLDILLCLLRLVFLVECSCVDERIFLLLEFHL